MGLRETLQDAVVTAIAAIDNIAVEVVYSRVTSLGTYDPATDSQTPTVSTVTLQGFLYKEKELTQDWKTSVQRDQKLLLAATSLGFAPSEVDYLTIDSVRWEIVSVKTIPGDCGYILTIRVP